MRDLFELPRNLPIPTDDGAADHLPGAALPGLKLQSTSNRLIDLKNIKERVIIFFYPRTGEPNVPAPEDWDLIPGARGCTPQSCGFRDLYAEFKKFGYQVYGASSQNSQYQGEFVARNHIPFEILSDSNFELTESLKLPTFTYNGLRLIKRMALVIDQGIITKVFYPVFPPNENATKVLEWI